MTFFNLSLINHDHFISNLLTIFNRKLDNSSNPPGQRYNHQLPLIYQNYLSFYGERQNKTSYDIWYDEVEWLMKNTVNTSINLQTIRRSLHGNSARVLMRLRTEAFLDDSLMCLWNC